MQKKKKTFTGFVFRPPFPVLLLLLPPPSLGAGLAEAPPRARRTGLGSRRRAAGAPANERLRPPTEGALGSGTAPSAAPVPGAWGRAFSDSGGVRRWFLRAPGVAGERKGFAPPHPGRPARLRRGRRAPWARPRVGRGSPGGKPRGFEKVAGVASGEGGKVRLCNRGGAGRPSHSGEGSEGLGRPVETPGRLITHPSLSWPSRDDLAEGAGDTHGSVPLQSRAGGVPGSPTSPLRAWPWQLRGRDTEAHVRPGNAW